MHSNVTKTMLPAKMLSWPHFSWATLYVSVLRFLCLNWCSYLNACFICSFKRINDWLIKLASHMGSHNVTCHPPAFPPLPHACSQLLEPVLDLAIPGNARLEIMATIWMLRLSSFYYTSANGSGRRYYILPMKFLSFFFFLSPQDLRDGSTDREPF